MKNINITQTGAIEINSKNICILEISQAAYAGLEISESLNINVSSEAETETILIVEWVAPDWAEKPLLKMDYPNMGYVVYCEVPPPP